MKYTLYELVRKINNIEYDNEIKKIKHTFDFDDCSVFVRGFVYGDFEYYDGDWWTPGGSRQIGAVGAIDEVIISHIDEDYFMDGKEIDELDKKLSW